MYGLPWLAVSTTRERLRALAPELAVALLVALLCVYRSRAGLRFVPDGWAVWEGSVSLLERGTYAYFAGDPIRYWPPLPSLLLAATQALLGTSCAAVLVFLAAVSGLGWLGWSRLTARLLADAPRPALRVAVGWLHAALVLGAGSLLLGHVVVLALLPWFLAALLDLLHGPEEGRTGARVRLGLAGAALLLSHHTAVIFFPSAAVWLLLRRAGRRELLLDAAPLAAASAVWLASRLLLDQGRSHPLLLGGRAGPTAYLVQLVTGLGELVSPTWWAPVTFPLGLLLLGLALVAARAREAPPARVVASIGLGGLAGLWVLFDLIWISDALRDRFVWSFPLLAVPAAAVVLARRSAAAAVALVLLAAAIPTARWVVEGQLDWPARGVTLVPPAAWISTRPRAPGDADRIEPWARPHGAGTSAVEDMHRLEGR